MAALWWVIAAAVLGVAEVVLPALVFGTLVVAALVGALVAALGGGFPAQALTASAAALVLLALVRPLVVRRWHLQGRFRPSGTAAHVGQPARVLVEVTELGGRVKLAGEEWSARSEHPGQRHPPGAAVLVVAIDGATAVVRAVATGSPATGPVVTGPVAGDPAQATPTAPPSLTSPEEPRP